MSTSTDRPGHDPDRTTTPAERTTDRTTDARPADTRTTDSHVADTRTTDARAADTRTIDADGDGVRDDARVAASDESVREERYVPDPAVRAAMIDRERERFGGISFGSAFFGWLTALGLAALLSALLAATGAALGLGTVGDAVDEAVAQDPQTIGVIGAIALLVALFVAYFAGGYVAGRMARFNGVRQGFAVWLWAVVMAGVGAAIAAIAGSRYDVFASLNTFPRIPVTEGDLTLAGIVTLILLVLVTLGGAVLGGKVGTRYHRRVDAAGFGV